MIIHIGSKNPAKVDAVKEIILNYPIFEGAKVNGIEVDSGVYKQPKSLKETIQGATNRAKSCFPGANYSFGIESGIMEVPGTVTGYMDICACAIYDGKNVRLGLSSAFEYPKEITRLILSERLDATEAALKAGITANTKIGSEQGLIGLLTGGRLTRKKYTQEAIRTALVQIENPRLY